jgi:hypothetical protein
MIQGKKQKNEARDIPPSMCGSFIAEGRISYPRKKGFLYFAMH